MEFTINTSYRLITRQFSVDTNDIYYINPFDGNGFLINQFNIELNFEYFDYQYPILIFVPKIDSFQGQYNFKINIVATALLSTIPPQPIVFFGNEIDYFNQEAVYSYQGATLRPVSIVGTTNAGETDPNAGWYVVDPYYLPRGRGLLLSAEDAPQTATSSFIELYNSAKSH